MSLWISFVASVFPDHFFINLAHCCAGHLFCTFYSIVLTTFFFAKLALWIIFANLYNAETNYVAFYLTKFPKFHLKQNGKIDRIFFGLTYSIDLFGAELSSYQLSWKFSAFMPYNAIWTDKNTDPKINTFCS